MHFFILLHHLYQSNHSIFLHTNTLFFQRLKSTRNEKSRATTNSNNTDSTRVVGCINFCTASSFGGQQYQQLSRSRSTTVLLALASLGCEIKWRIFTTIRHVPNGLPDDLYQSSFGTSISWCLLMVKKTSKCVHTQILLVDFIQL